MKLYSHCLNSVMSQIFGYQTRCFVLTLLGRNLPNVIEKCIVTASPAIVGNLILIPKRYEMAFGFDSAVYNYDRTY